MGRVFTGKFLRFTVSILMCFSSYGIIHPADIHGSTCIDYHNLANPGLDDAVRIIDFYEKPWNEWLLDVVKRTYENQPSKINLLQKVYERSGFKLIFFETEMLPKDSVKVLLKYVTDLREMEGKYFPELKKVSDSLNALEQFMSQKALPPEELAKSNLKFCFSRNAADKVYIGGLVESPEVEAKLKKWACERINRQISLMKLVVESDVRLTGMLFRYVNYVNPFVLEKLDIEKFRNAESMNDYLKSLHPRNQHYRTLSVYLKKYKELANAEQIVIKKGPSLRMGMSGAAVLNLQKRLSQEGYLSKDSVTGVFDILTEKAVKSFQRAHFLKTDGVVGPKTRSKLNISYSKKYNWIKFSLDRLRNCPCRILDNYIWINIPTFTLEYYRNGKLVSVHKVIVGRATGSRITIKGVHIHRNNSLPLISEIKAVVFNPRWYVPERIRRELEKDVEKDPDYFKKGGFRELKNSLYSWGEPRIYQLPGESNPLGKVKFIFDNPFGIFLHDTSQPRLFKKSFRAFSHGCIRVENALKLAGLILADTNPYAFKKIKTYLSKKDQTYVTLKEPIPIFITYIPVMANGENTLAFGGDVYGWMEKNGKLPDFFYIK